MGQDRRNWLRAALLALLLCVALPALAAAGEPPAEPQLRIESDMHTAILRRIATDAASRYLVSGSYDKTVRVWDLPSGRLLRILRPPIGSGHEGKIYAVAMSPDGSTIACGGWTGYGWDKSSSIYLFDRATGRLLRGIPGLPDSVARLAWSPDGRMLAVGLLGKGGIRVFRVQDGAQIGADTPYGDNTYGIDVERGGKLVSGSYDGTVRLYRVSESGLALIGKQTAPGGKRPYTARFSPDGSKVAIGYDDTRRVDVLSADTLALLYSPDTQAINTGDLAKVAWSADGRVLYGAGQYQTRLASGIWTHMIRVWGEEGRGGFTDLPAAHNTISEIVALRTGGVVFSSDEPRLGAFDGAGRKILDQGPVIADFRNNAEGFRVSKDGTSVLFSFELRGKAPARFDLSDRRLVVNPGADAALVAPVTQAPGLDVRDWRDAAPPLLNGQALKLQPYESSRGLAIAPDQQSFVLGAEWTLRRFDRQGKQLWSVVTPGTAWAVNISGDGKLVVGAFGDGTIRWHRLSDGAELLALFPHVDRRRWVLWSPSGYYDASAGGEELIGWHLNRGRETAADFYPASRFRATFYRPDVIAKVLETLDEQAGLRLANEDTGRATRVVEIAKTLPPVVEILSPVDGAAVSTAEVRVTFRVRTAGDAPVLALKSRVNGQTVNVRSITEARAGEAREVAIPVPSQDSDIMVFAENRHGVSVPAVLRVTWRGTTPVAAAAGEFAIKPKLYLLAVGVGRYQNADLKLQFPAKDARDFAQAMALQKGRLYRDVEAKVLTDAQATRDEIVDGLDWLQRQVTAKDVAMLFLAGHGVNDPTGIYYYLPVNADVERLKRTGVPFSDIRNTLSALAGKALFFVDTCHAGNVMGTRRAAGPADITAVVNELASAENGVVVFASSTGRQYSLESPQWQNGAFTKALVEGLTGQADLGKTGKITHKMLDFFVSERVKELTGGKQTPVNPSPKGVPDFPIALVK